MRDQLTQEQQEAGMVAIGQAIAQNKSIRYLSVRQNQLSAASAAALRDSIMSSTSLQVLDLHDNKLDDAGVRRLCMGMISVFRNPRFARPLALLEPPTAFKPDDDSWMSWQYWNPLDEKELAGWKGDDESDEKLQRAGRKKHKHKHKQHRKQEMMLDDEVGNLKAGTVPVDTVVRLMHTGQLGALPADRQLQITRQIAENENLDEETEARLETELQAAKFVPLEVLCFKAYAQSRPAVYRHRVHRDDLVVPDGDVSDSNTILAPRGRATVAATSPKETTNAFAVLYWECIGLKEEARVKERKLIGQTDCILMATAPKYEQAFNLVRGYGLTEEHMAPDWQLLIQVWHKDYNRELDSWDESREPAFLGECTVQGTVVDGLMDGGDILTNTLVLGKQVNKDERFNMMVKGQHSSGVWALDIPKNPSR